MKKFILSLSLLLTIAAVAVANVYNDTNPRIKASFEKEFAGAEQVRWSRSGDYSKASFVVSGFRAEAWFSNDGELVVVARSIFYNQLPMAAMRSLEKAYPNVTMIEIMEITTQSGTRYNLSFEQKEKKFKAVLYPDGSISDVYRIKRK